MTSNSEYIETEFGKIPNNWKIDKLENISLYINRGITPRYTEKDGVVVINQRCIRDGFVDLNNARLTNPDKKKINKEKYLKKFDILINSTGVGTLGRVSQLHRLHETMTVDSHVTIVRPDPERIHPIYLGYFLKNIQRWIEDIAEGSTGQIELQRNLVKSILVNYPSRNKQMKIANILLNLDLKIDLNQKMNKTLVNIGQLIFKKWFIDFEFPNKNGKSYKSNGGKIVYSDELDKEIPIGWKIKPIDEIANYLNGLAMQKYPPEGDEYLPVIKIREMKQGITKNTDKASKNIPEEYVIEDGDVIFSWSGSLNVCIWGHGKGALNQHLFKVASEKFPKWFYYNWIKYYLPKFRHIASGKATTMGHIKRNHLTETKVVVPPENIINKLDRLLNPLFEKYINNLVESRNLAKIRDTLLPKLMSGKIRFNLKEMENRGGD